MRKLIFAILLLVLFAGFVAAQSKHHTFRTNERNIRVEEKASPDVVFMFNDFQPATVYYPDEVLVQLRLNYRLIRDEMIVIGERGDVKSLATGRRLDSLIVNNMVFVYHNIFGFLEKVPGIEQNNFFIKHQSTYSMSEIRQGAYGKASPSASVQNVSTISGANRSGARQVPGETLLENVSGNEVEVVVIRKPQLGYMKDNVLRSANSRRELQALFPEHSSEIRSFLRKERISFDRREDLIKVAQFLSQLK